MAAPGGIVQLTVEQARDIAKKAVEASEAPANKEKPEAASKQLNEQAAGDPAKFGQLVPVVFTPVVIECLGDVLDELGIPKDQGGVMQFVMAMMMHGQDPEVMQFVMAMMMHGQDP